MEDNLTNTEVDEKSLQEKISNVQQIENVVVPEPLVSPNNQPQKSNLKIYLILTLILVSFTLALLLGLRYKSNKAVEYPNDSSPTQVPIANKDTDVSPNPTSSDLAKLNWITHTEEEMGFSFKIPESWNFVSGRGDNNVDFDILSPDKEMFVGISVYIDKRIIDGMSIQDVLSEKEKEIKTSEIFKLADFKSTVQKDEGSYTISGEEWYLNFANENAWEESDGITYNFFEKGYFRSDGKTVYLHRMFLPGSPMESVATQIVDSFVLK